MTESNIRDLRTSSNDQSALIEALDALREQAERGELLSIAVAGVAVNNETLYSVVNSHVDPPALIGQLGSLRTALEFGLAVNQGILEVE
jgi:hypothetical protein